MAGEAQRLEPRDVTAGVTYAHAMKAGRDIIVVGGSAGALEPLGVILSSLPAEFGGTILVALHRQGTFPDEDRLALVLQRESRLPVHTAQANQGFEPGHVYLAPADWHLVLEPGAMRLEHGPKQLRFRPGVDALFRSAALAYGRRVVAVLLSGIWGEDGTTGLWEVRKHGGVAVVQDPLDARHKAMPENAIRNVAVDFVLPAHEIAPVLCQLSAPLAVIPSARLLVVEDEAIVAANLRQGLLEAGFASVSTAASGDQAIEIAERELPDLVLMDIRLGGGTNGVEAARRIWQKQQVPVVYCTAYSDMETLRAAQTTECYGYVVKPFHIPGVLAVIEMALERRRREHALSPRA